MTEKIAIRIMSWYLTRVFIKRHLRIPNLNYVHSSDGDTLTLVLRSEPYTIVRGCWLGDIIGLKATSINTIVERTYKAVRKHVNRHYHYVLVTECGIEGARFSSLEYVVTPNFRRSPEFTVPLKEYVYQIILDAFRNLYGNLGVKLIVEDGQVKGLKPINIKKAELKLYRHYKEVMFNRHGENPLDRACYYGEGTVYPFNRIRNRLKIANGKKTN